MPTFDEYEESAEQSVPIEGYEFVGSFKTYRYTSADRAVTINGEVYEPIPISRARVKAGTQEDDGLSLDLTMPFDVDVVTDYAYAQTPPKLRLTVYRNQQDDPENDAWSLFWYGRVRGFNVEERTCTIKVPSVFSEALQGEIPNVYYQAPCNHVLYSTRCGVLRATHRFLSHVDNVDGVNIGLTTTPTTDNDLAAGEIVNLRNGERRLILTNAGEAIGIGYAFVDLQIGDEVEMVRGCNHALPECKAKFNNVINFGGFHYIPAENPFDGKIA